MQTVEYAPGRFADIIGDLERPTVLLWHGQQPDARSAVRSLAELIAGHGLAVVASDWDSTAPDRGRSDLLGSVRFVREQAADPDGVILAGWSMGGLAAAALTLEAGQFDFTFAHTVCLAGAFMVPDPIFGTLPAERTGAATGRTPFTVLHGSADRVIPLPVAGDFADALRRDDWAVSVVELAADHGSIAGARYDADAQAYFAATDAETLAVAADVAARIAGAARSDR